MKKLIFITALLITFILIPSFAFSDENIVEIKYVIPTPVETKKLPNDEIENLQFSIEYNDTNSVPINIIDDSWENIDQIQMEFRVCG